jgi:hypothetical protein
VPVVTFDSFAAENSVANINLLKTDTQGYDLEELKGAEGLLQAGSISLVLTECNFERLYEGQPVFSQLLAFLESHRFRPVSFCNETILSAGWMHCS